MSDGQIQIKVSKIGLKVKTKQLRVESEK